MRARWNLPVPPLAWYWLVASLGLVVAPHLLRLPLWLSGLCLAAIGWRLLRDRRGWPLPQAGMRLGLTLLAIGAVFAAFGTLLGQDAGVALLTVMVSLKLVEMATVRDATVVVLLAYFLIAAGFLFDQSLLAGLYLFTTVIVLTTALVVLNHPGARADLSRTYLRRTATLFLQALPLMAVLFVLFPRPPGIGLPVATAGGASRTGLSDSMTLGNVSRLAESREVAFRVEFDSALPPPNGWYWRGPVLWHTDGRRWDLLTVHELHTAGPPRHFLPLGTPVDYTVSLKGNATARWLPALDLPASVPAGAVATADLQLLAAGAPPSADRRYAVRSYGRFRLLGLTPELRAMALALPPGMNPSTRALGEKWAATYPEPEARVAAAMRHFREQPFHYTRRPPRLGKDHPLDEFLFESRRGFCESYAAAFVYLMRAAGVPARVITGYQGGEFNRVGNYWVVRQADAHAWAEVYLEEQGWRRVDPTRAIPPSRVEEEPRTDGPLLLFGRGDGPPRWTADALRWVAQGWDALDYQWGRWITGYSGERQRELMERLKLQQWGLAGLAIGLMAAGSGALLFGGWLALRSGGERDPAVRLYQRYCRKLARIGLERGPAEGEREFARRVAAALPPLGGAAQAITEEFQALRYGPGSLGGLQRLRRQVQRFRP